MTSLEVIKEEIKYYNDLYEKKLIALGTIREECVGRKQLKDEVSFCIKHLHHLKQIKLELEIMELIKLNCTGLKYNSDGDSAIKLGNINAMDFIKLNNRLDKICDWKDEND